MEETEAVGGRNGMVVDGGWRRGQMGTCVG